MNAGGATSRARVIAEFLKMAALTEIGDLGDTMVQLKSDQDSAFVDIL